MLPPHQRELLLAALRPPDGYRFDRGIGTTFSLDLYTLLIAPLSLAWVDVADAESVLQDPVLLLEGVQRYADRLTIFCQAGRIAIPRTASPLFRFLEGSVVEVKAPRQNGVFHPKVWLLRYAGQTATPFYRLLCLTRNLTFDRSWDLILRLEGEVAETRKRAYGRNNPLGDFVQALPTLAVAADEVSQRTRDDVDLLQGEVRRVAFRLPQGFAEDLAFYPSGIPGYRAYKFEEPYNRSMVISPFLTESFLNDLTRQGRQHALISTVDSLAPLPQETISRFSSIYVLDDGAAAEMQDDGDSGTESEAPGRPTDPNGLHAKLFVLEQGWNATWLMGSANATDAAFDSRNVEFMVELKGRRSDIGIDKLLGAEGDSFSLRSLLRLYQPTPAPAPVDRQAAQAEKLAETVRTWLIRQDLRAEVAAQGDDLYTFRIAVHGNDPQPPGTYTISAWPISLRPEHGRRFELPLAFAGLSLTALTPFVAFEVKATLPRATYSLRFVLKLPVTGMPEGRDEQLLTAILSNRVQFLRLLRLILLQDEDGAVGGLGDLVARPASSSRGFDAWLELPLLEEMVRALSRTPGKIDRIARLVEQLERTPEGRALFPEGFESLWQAIKVARSTPA